MKHLSNCRQWLGALVLTSLALTGCYHSKTPEERAAAERQTVEGRMVPWEELTPREQVEQLVISDILAAQRIERGEANTRPGDSVTFSRDGKNYRFANVHAYRANIKHRLDSLLATGPLTYDTIPKGPAVTGTLHTIHTSDVK
jgi:hypothetical protein